MERKGSPAPATGTCFNEGKGGKNPSQGCKEEERSRARGWGARQSAKPFLLHRTYVSVHFPGRCTRPRWHEPLRAPAEHNSLPLRVEGRGFVLGLGVPLPVPLDGRRPLPRLFPAPPQFPAPARGLPAFQHSRWVLGRCSVGQSFRVGMLCKTERHPSPIKRGFRNAGRRRRRPSEVPTPLGCLSLRQNPQTLPFPSLPPPLLVSFWFCFWVFFVGFFFFFF